MTEQFKNLSKKRKTTDAKPTP